MKWILILIAIIGALAVWRTLSQPSCPCVSFIELN